MVLLSGFPVAGAPKLPSMCWKVNPAIRTGVLGSFTPRCGGAVDVFRHARLSFQASFQTNENDGLD